MSGKVYNLRVVPIYLRTVNNAALPTFFSSFFLSFFLCHRCNLAVILLTDVVVDSIDVDWSMHMPLMLHILFLGMDQSRNLINQHCKQLLLNLLIVLANHSDHLAVAQILLNRKVIHLGLGLSTPLMVVPFHNFTGMLEKLRITYLVSFFSQLYSSIFTFFRE